MTNVNLTYYVLFAAKIKKKQKTKKKLHFFNKFQTSADFFHTNKSLIEEDITHKTTNAEMQVTKQQDRKQKNNTEHILRLLRCGTKYYVIAKRVTVYFST